MTCETERTQNVTNIRKIIPICDCQKKKLSAMGGQLSSLLKLKFYYCLIKVTLSILPEPLSSFNTYIPALKPERSTIVFEAPLLGLIVLTTLPSIVLI